MNTVILIGRLTRNPSVNYTTTATPTCIARYTLAVDRRFKKDGEQNADFINCVAFGKIGEFAEKYLSQGTKIAIQGRLQTGSYTDRDGNKVYTTDVIVESQEFVESKATQNASQNAQNGHTQARNTQPTNPMPRNEKADTSGFMSIPNGIESELPFL